MGVIYKLSSEVKEAIVEEKKNNPRLSCRKLIAVIQDKYKIKVSKSSINALIKTAGLSLPVGRKGKTLKIKPFVLPPVLLPEALVGVPAAPPAFPMAEPVITKPKAHPSVEIPGLGAIFLKAADYLLGGSLYFSEAIKKQLNDSDPQLLTKTECLIYQSLNPRNWLLPLLNQDILQPAISSYLIDLQRVPKINYDLYRIINNILQPVRGMKFILSDNSVFYIDGQWQSVWSSPHTPLDFAVRLCEAKGYIKRYFQDNQPCLFFMASPDSCPSDEFFAFISAMQNKGKKLQTINLYGDNLESLESINLDSAKERNFIFGLWSWQFSQNRVVKKIGEFRPFNFAPLKLSMYLADIEVVLTQTIVNKSVTLKGAALKTKLNEKISLFLLSNIDDSSSGIEGLVGAYLAHWPNLEEGLVDFNHKLEFLAYASEGQSLALDKFNPNNLSDAGTPALLNQYLKALDLYVKRFFLPLSCQNMDFSTINAQFYSLKAILDRQENNLIIRFILPAEYKFSKELEYACRRVNQREVAVGSNLRIWLSRV